MTRDQIRRKLKDQCNKDGWSVARLSRESKVSQRAINGFLEGRDEVSPPVLYRLCQACGLNERS